MYFGRYAVFSCSTVKNGMFVSTIGDQFKCSSEGRLEKGKDGTEVKGAERKGRDRGKGGKGKGLGVL